MTPSVDLLRTRGNGLDGTPLDGWRRRKRDHAMVSIRGDADEIERQYADGDIIFREGDETREMYVVQRGAVAITRMVNGREVVIETRGKGDFIGEMALLESLPRSATARAQGPTSLLVIYTGGFIQKLRRDPTFAFEMLQKLSSRFRKVHEQLMALMEEKDRSEGEKGTARVLIEYQHGDHSS